MYAYIGVLRCGQRTEKAAREVRKYSMHTTTANRLEHSRLTERPHLTVSSLSSGIYGKLTVACRPVACRPFNPAQQFPRVLDALARETGIPRNRWLSNRSLIPHWLGELGVSTLYTHILSEACKTLGREPYDTRTKFTCPSGGNTYVTDPPRTCDPRYDPSIVLYDLESLRGLRIVFLSSLFVLFDCSQRRARL